MSTLIRLPGWSGNDGLSVRGVEYVFGAATQVTGFPDNLTVDELAQIQAHGFTLLAPVITVPDSTSMAQAASPPSFVSAKALRS